MTDSRGILENVYYPAEFILRWALNGWKRENKYCIKKNTKIFKNLLKKIDLSVILKKLWHDSYEA